MKTQEDFRHRSKQALMQMRIQSLVLAIFFRYAVGICDSSVRLQKPLQLHLFIDSFVWYWFIVNAFVGRQKKWNI